mmetsp:Transcript_10275/g.62975  ORF Transcript_10275/g.62975 Transcript_10275/m.62975 type:complete len:119 (+) Transcript_10275:3608-3964(+)
MQDQKGRWRKLTNHASWPHTLVPDKITSSSPAFKRRPPPDRRKAEIGSPKPLIDHEGMYRSPAISLWRALSLQAGQTPGLLEVQQAPHAVHCGESRGQQQLTGTGEVSFYDEQAMLAQ